MNYIGIDIGSTCAKTAVLDENAEILYTFVLPTGWSSFETVTRIEEALMCQGNFGGHSEEYIIWVYGSDSLARFNGVVVLGNHVCSCNVKEKNGLLYTDFNRTIADALANEAILDMQGITEAISRYYYRNGESFEGLSIVPEYQEKFERLAVEAIEYYEN